MRSISQTIYYSHTPLAPPHQGLDEYTNCGTTLEATRANQTSNSSHQKSKDSALITSDMVRFCVKDRLVKDESRMEGAEAITAISECLRLHLSWQTDSDETLQVTEN